MRRRTEAAARLWHRQAVDLIIPSGGTIDGRPAEAAVMATLLIADGVPSRAILPESASGTTWETARHVRAMLDDQDTVIVISDGYHIPRCKLALRAFGIRALPSPERVTARVGPALLRQALREVPAYLFYLARFVGRRSAD